MRILGIHHFDRFMHRHANFRQGVGTWVATLSHASWLNSHELIAALPRTRGLGQGRFVFKLCGNHVRAIVVINFRIQVIDVRFVGTHVEYDRVDALKI